MKNINTRKSLLMFAVDAVMHPSIVNLREEGHEGRTAYIKSYDEFGVKAISSEDGDKIEYVFTSFNNSDLRKGKKLKRK